MPNYSLVLARTLAHAEISILSDWKWDSYNELRNEFRRPDTGERVRFAPDVPSALNDLRWNTKVYLGLDWHMRNDASRIVDLIESGFFVNSDPELPNRRERKSSGNSSYVDKVKQLAEFTKANEIIRRR